MNENFDVLYQNLNNALQRISILESQNTLSSGMIGYYSFNGNANDESGNGNHGVVEGAVLTTDARGNLNSAYEFNGSSKIQIELFSGFDWGDQFSVSVWFKRSGGYNDYHGIVNNGYAYHGSWEIRHGREDSGTRIFSSLLTENNTDFQVASITGTASVNGWHHGVLTYNGSKHSFFLDNVLIGEKSTSGSILVKNTPVTIGQSGFGRVDEPLEFFIGKIDEVRIYKRALSSLDVDRLYNSYKP